MMNTTIKGWITTFLLTAAVLTSTTSVNAGTIIGGRSLTDTDPCNETITKSTSKDSLGGTIIGGLTGTIIGGLAGTIIGGLTGTIIGGVTDDSPVNCGTIIGG